MRGAEESVTMISNSHSVEFPFSSVISTLAIVSSVIKTPTEGD